MKFATFMITAAVFGNVASVELQDTATPPMTEEENAIWVNCSLSGEYRTIP